MTAPQFQKMNLMDDPCWPVVEDAPTPYTHRGAFLPGHLRESLDRYAKHGVPTGDFLKAVLANNLIEAFGRADSTSMAALPAIACYVYNCLPSECWGNAEKVQAHIDRWFPRYQEWNRPADGVDSDATLT